MKDDSRKIQWVLISPTVGIFNRDIYFITKSTTGQKYITPNGYYRYVKDKIDEEHYNYVSYGTSYIEVTSAINVISREGREGFYEKFFDSIKEYERDYIEFQRPYGQVKRLRYEKIKYDTPEGMYIDL